MKTILAPIDFSSGTSLIIDEAATMASALHGRLILLHVVDTLPAAAGEFDFAEAAARITLSATTGAIRELANWQHRLGRKGITSLTHHVTGVAGTAILEQARAFGADYIVVGTRGHSSLYELVIGGTAQRVIKDAPCPVLVVPSAVSRKIPTAPFKSKSVGNHRRS